jgi:hypothetical protein
MEFSVVMKHRAVLSRMSSRDHETGRMPRIWASTPRIILAGQGFGTFGSPRGCLSAECEQRPTGVKATDGAALPGTRARLLSEPVLMEPLTTVLMYRRRAGVGFPLLATRWKGQSIACHDSHRKRKTARIVTDDVNGPATDIATRVRGSTPAAGAPSQAFILMVTPIGA